MRYTHTPDQKITLSSLGIGTYALSGVYGPKDLDEFRRMLRKAHHMGVTLFDTAPVYGDAEKVLGEVLGGVRHQVVISTKVAAGLEGGPNCSYQRVIASCEESLHRLGTDYIDLYQIHFDDGQTPASEVVQALEHLSDSGKIRSYGIGHVSYDRAKEYVELGRISTLMGELNAASRRYYSRMLPLARSAGAGYLGFSLTGRGILTGAFQGREGLAQEDIRRVDAVFAGQRLRSALRIKDRLAGMGKRMGVTATQAAIAWGLAQETVVAGLVGPSSVRHLEEDLAAADLDIPRSLLDEFGGFLAREDTRLAGALKTEILRILKREIRDVTGVSDLIYAMEGLAELDMVPEARLTSHMRFVIKTARTGRGDFSALDRIRRELCDHVASS